MKSDPLKAMEQFIVGELVDANIRSISMSAAGENQTSTPMLLTSLKQYFTKADTSLTKYLLEHPYQETLISSLFKQIKARNQELLEEQLKHIHGCKTLFDRTSVCLKRSKEVSIELGLLRSQQASLRIKLEGNQLCLARFETSLQASCLERTSLEAHIISHEEKIKELKAQLALLRRRQALLESAHEKCSEEKVCLSNEVQHMTTDMNNATIPIALLEEEEKKVKQDLIDWDLLRNDLLPSRPFFNS